MLSSDQKWRKKRRQGNWWVPHLYKACAAFACFLSESFLEVCVLIFKFTVKSVMAEVIKTEVGGEVCSDFTVHTLPKPGSRGSIFLQILNATETAMWSPNPLPPLPKCALRLPSSLSCLSLRWPEELPPIECEPKRCGPCKIPIWNPSCSFHLISGCNDHNRQIMSGNQVLKRAEWNDRRLDLWVGT